MLKKAKWLAKEATLRVKYMTNRDCIFCKIVSGEIATEFIAQTDPAVAFWDINPVADVHILIVPKKHIESVGAVTWADSEELVGLFLLAKKIAKKRKLGAYRLGFNAGAYQHVPHLHMHLLAGEGDHLTRI